MSFISVGKENSSDIHLYYEDHGRGQPVVLIHGYPQTGAAWEKEASALTQAGFRVITYDRRGFGKSSRPAQGYDYDTFAADLDRVLTQLDLRDVVLVGHSMGTGEICRYLSRYGKERVARTVMISGILPWLLHSDSNPEGVSLEQIQAFETQAKQDRFAFLTMFFKAFFSSGLLRHNGVSDEAVRYNETIGSLASPVAIQQCIRTWITDFREDISAITVPTMIIHGRADKVVPFEASAARLKDLIPSARLVAIDGGPHSLPWTHADEINREILGFLGAGAARAVA